MIFMKTNIRLLFTACAAALVTGCTNLDVDVESQYTEYPTNEIAVEAKMADVYYQMRDVFGRRYMEAQALSSDEYTAVSYGMTVVHTHIQVFTTIHTKMQPSTGWDNLHQV